VDNALSAPDKKKSSITLGFQTQRHLGFSVKARHMGLTHQHLAFFPLILSQFYYLTLGFC
jgi:hypothetical protein